MKPRMPRKPRIKAEKHREVRPVPGFPYKFPSGAWDYSGPFPPRDYQRKMVEAVWLRFQNYDATFIVAGTGTGKTCVMSHICRLWPRKLGRILILVNRDELIWQTKDKVRAICPEDIVEVEASVHHADPGSKYDLFAGRSRIVVASKDTLWRPERLRQFSADTFSLIIVDEAHHCISANSSYWNILKHFRSAYLLGVSATPGRHDRIAMEQVFASVAYNYPMADAIVDGWLTPIVQQYLIVKDFDLSHVRTNKSGDLDDAERNTVMMQEKVLHGICHPTIDLSNKKTRWGCERPAIMYTCSVDHAKTCAEIFNRHHYRENTGLAAWIACEDITMDERRDIVARYDREEIRYLVNVATLLEGFNSEITKMITMARPTKSKSLYEQALGRGVRPHRTIVHKLNDARNAEERRSIIYNSAKPSALIIDPVGNSGEHKLVSVADVLGGDYCEEDISAAKDRIKADEGRGDVIKELQAAKRAREEQEATRRKEIIIKTTYETRQVDPFNIFDLHAGHEPGWCKQEPPSDNARRYLAKEGVPAAEISRMNFHEAAELCKEIIERRRSGKCTYQQAKILKQYGYNGEMSFNEARRTLDALTARGWQK